MDIIIEDNVMYRDKKKWMRRFCKLVRTNSFSDSVKLLVCVADDCKMKRSPGKQSISMLSKHVIYGHLHGVHMGSQSYVMYIVCKSTVECLAFEDFDTMKLWSDLLGKHLHDISQFVDLIYADKHSQLKSKLEGRLFFNCSHISFIRSPSSSEPKLLMSWKIADIMEYGCRHADTKGANKVKQKNSVFTDESLNLFIMKVSPLCHRAPNTHVFSCKDPKQFCDWMENLASNQENVLNLGGCEMSQRLRVDSYSTFHRSRDSSESSPECDLSSSGGKSLRFFGDQSHSKTPRFQRSISEVRQRRSRPNSEDDILEREEQELTELNVSLMCKSDKTDSTLTSDFPHRSATITMLERYPFERDRGHKPMFRRQMSEGNQTVSYNSNAASKQMEFTLPRPKSSNNYCSLLNLRQKSGTSAEPSPSYLPPTGAHGPPNPGKDHHGPSHQYVNLSDTIMDCQFHQYVPPYVKIELNELVNEISEYCKTEIGSV